MKPRRVHFITSDLFKRYIRFGLVGASGMVVDTAILFCLADSRMLGWDLSASKVIAAETAMLSNFLWNDLWTFGDYAAARPKRHWIQRLGKFNLICLGGLAISLGLLDLQVYCCRFNPYVANVVAIVVASVWNFGMNLKFAWGSAGPAKIQKLPKQQDMEEHAKGE